jgi:hypothetical protein
MKAVVLYTALAACLACGPPVNPDAFKKFEAATTELRDGADKTLALQSRWAQRRFANSLQHSDTDTLTNRYVQMLLLDAVDGDPFGWQSPSTPFYVVTRQFRAAVKALNAALVDYASLLNDLSRAGAVNRDELDRRVTDINNGTRTAASLVKPEPPHPSVAIVSIMAARFLEDFVDDRRNELLVSAVRANGPALRELCALLNDAMTLTARGVRAEYDQRSFALADQLTHTRTGSGHRRDLINDLMKLNDLYTQHLATLRSLHDVYARLPAAHAELARTGKQSSIEELQRLYEDARRVSAGYDREE